MEISFPAFLNACAGLGAGCSVLPGSRERPLAGLFIEKQSGGSSPVFPGHEVVKDRVDTGTQVEQQHGDHVEVLTEFSRKVIVDVNKNVSPNVKRQPADCKSQNDNSCKTKNKTEQQKCKKANTTSIFIAWHALDHFYLVKPVLR